MALSEELDSLYIAVHQKMPPEVSKIIKSSTADFKASYDLKSATQVGQPLPTFKLQDAVGKEVSSADLLAQGRLLISFYRGEWCPFCNLEIATLQKHLSEFKARGVTLVAISPELPDTSLSMTQKHDLKFPILSDVGNRLAAQMGILFPQPEELKKAAVALGIDFKARTGDESMTVPVPATFLVGTDGIVRNAFVDADYTKRLEPATALAWIDAL
jgi:peroxiredoxin